MTYKGIEGDVYLFEIYENGFDGEVTEIHGYVNHYYADRKDLLQPIVASSLDISLEADENLTLQDLYTEDESKFKCSLKRNNQVIFYGILKPDGIWEDWINDRWEISMDAMDGLSIMKDLSFVKDDGTFYDGKITQFEVLEQCLHRIGYDLPINITKDLPVYDGFTGTGSVLKSVLMNADRFYQDAEKDNIMDCEEVLKSILEPYSATIIQMNGEWWVFRAIDVKDTILFHRYDLEATRTDVIWNAGLEIGSHIDDYDIHHVSANQKKSITASTQAFRVNYKYGNVKNTLTNPTLDILPDLTSEGWIINQFNDRVRAQDDGSGIVWAAEDQDESLWIIELNQSVVLAKLESIRLSLAVRTVSDDEALNIFISVYVATENFVYDYDKWVLKSNTDPINSSGIGIYGSGEMVLNFDFDQIPETSPVFLQVYVGSSYEGDNPNPIPYEVFFDSIEISPSDKKSTIKGEFHTAQRLTRISSVTKADKTVAVGDSLSDIYYGTLYKDTGVPTETWTRIGDATGKPILQIMAEDALRISPRPMLFFEGNIKGYVPYLSNVLINNIAGNFQISKYSYDTQSDINNTNFREYSTAEITDFRYEFTYDYGETTKVTVI